MVDKERGVVQYSGLKEPNSTFYKCGDRTNQEITIGLRKGEVAKGMDKAFMGETRREEGENYIAYGQHRDNYFSPARGERLSQRTYE